jgi:hypothetical protein
METLFKKDDKVFDIRYGWGRVKYIYRIDWEKAGPEILVCEVEFDKKKAPYIYTKKLASRVLSFTEYTLQGFSQERPINYDEYIGKWGKFWEEGENEILISILVNYERNNKEFPFETSNEYFSNFEPLTEEQVRVLNLDDIKNY